MNLYLNLDGVLHVNQVTYLPGRMPELDIDGYTVLQHAQLLADVLAGRSGVNIVLNTWWSYYLNVDVCLDLLPATLSSRVTGAVLGFSASYIELPHRAREAEKHIEGSRCKEYLILDHSGARYQGRYLPHLLAVNEVEGLTTPHAVRELRHRIDAILSEKQARLRNPQQPPGDWRPF
ncbi:HAD domain-containing protein [Paraburkholderia youngii]|uniref:Uncharacterized protein n=1 Tax=Paraburkholderia youngii TaxID=2782701 RepID=A0A7W8L570_9BURK|nr:hypothetical protein [Paraburkholderia youngii]